MKHVWAWVSLAVAGVVGIVLAIIGLGGWWFEVRRDRARRKAEFARLLREREQELAAETWALEMEGALRESLEAGVRVDDAGDLSGAAEAIRRAATSETD